MQQLYTPNKKIIIASSFEGVVNNGAKECAFVSFNAQNKMVNDGRLSGPSLFGKRLEVKPFRERHGEDFHTKAFLAMRPLVAVAEDYLVVVELLRKYSVDAYYIGVDGNMRALDALVREFPFEKMKTGKGTLEIFKKEFYAERKKQQEANYKEWLSLQSPYTDTIEQLRILNDLKDADPSNNIKGFVLYFVTSKDEKSTFELCVVYNEFKYFGPGEIGGLKLEDARDWGVWFEAYKTCLVSEDRIVGKDKVENADKVGQMKMVAEQENILKNQIFRLNDRYDKEEIAQLNAAGFVHNFIVTGGYAFPSDYEKAKATGTPVVEKNKLAETLSAYAKEKGF